MKAMRPFYLLLQRPMVLFGAIGWMIVATFLLANVVRPGGVPDIYLDAMFLSVIVLSLFAGWVVGSCLLELQQRTFTYLLPGNSRRVVPGFLVFGASTTLAAVLLVDAAGQGGTDFLPLLATGMASFATGASARDPQSGFGTGLGVVLVLLLVSTTGQQALLAQERPGLSLLLAAAIFAVGFFRLFRKSARRQRSVERGRPILVFSAAEVSRAARKRGLESGPRKSNWHARYLGDRTGSWLRTALHEAYGGLRPRAVLRTIAGSWGLLLVLLIEAWIYRSELGLWKSFCWVVHDSLMRSPYPPLTGEHSGGFLMVAILVFVGVASLAVWNPASLNESFLHPVSRRQKADLFFLGSLLDMAIILLLTVPLMLLMGHGAGLALGIPPRFDYLPFFFRTILVALILMPFAYWGGLKLRSGGWHGDRYSMVGVSLGMGLFGIVGLLFVFLSQRLFASAWLELLMLLTVLLFSRLLLYARVHAHFGRADLG